MPGLKLMAELGLDGSGFQAGFNKAKGLAAGVTEGLKGFVVQAVGVATVEEAIRRTVDTAKELVETSERLAIAPEQLQVLRQAAKESNIEFEKLAETFEKIDVARQKALIPGKEGTDARRAFGAAGINMNQLQTMTAAQLFTGPLRQMALNRNPEEIGVIFRELGVKAFGQLIPFLKKDFDGLSAEMKKFGGIMDTETAVKLKMLSDEFSLLTQIITSQLGPALIKFIEVVYAGILKLGGKTAGAAAFYGAGTANMSAGQTAATLLKTAGLGAEDIYARLFKGRTSEQSRAFLREGLTGMGFNVREASAAARAAQAPWEEKLKQFQAMLEEASKKAKELDNPKPPDLSKSAVPVKLSNKELLSPTDSLVRIGNFLGSNQNGMRLAERRTQFLQQIANNTKPRVAPPSSGREAPTEFPLF